MSTGAVYRALRLDPGPGNPRNSEGDFIQVADGKWFFVYTHFDGGDGDHAGAHLAGRVSNDDGVSWSHRDSMVLPNEATMNVMSVSLLRLADGRIALFYLRKNSLADCRPYLRYSTDEALTWTSPVEIIPNEEVGYYVVNNDRVVQLSSGLLVLPAALHRTSLHPPALSGYGTGLCYLSDDAGSTWHRGREVPVEASAGGDPVMIQEPGVVQLRGGQLMMVCRADAGSQYVAHSDDGGESWTPLRPSEIISPVSPASVKRIPATDDLLLVWNNHAGILDELVTKRTPLTLAISSDEGQHWTHVRDLEHNPHGWYCYTAIAFAGDDILLAYCAGDRRENNGLAALQVTRVPLAWVYGTP